MSGNELLLFARGPALNVAGVIFIVGLIIRLIEIQWLRRKHDNAPPHGKPWPQALRTIGNRFVPAPGDTRRRPVTVIGGYVFHIGLFIALFLFVPHIVFFDAIFGVSWPGLPNGIIDGVTLLTMAAMVALAVDRLKDPVKRMLTDKEDMLTWMVTFLPLLTGWFAVNRLFTGYDTMLALHLLTVELLLIVFPFTKLMHAFTWVLARGYQGLIAGRKGAAS